MPAHQVPMQSFHRSANLFDQGQPQIFKHEPWTHPHDPAMGFHSNIQHSTIMHMDGDDSQEPSPSFSESREQPPWAEMKTKAGKDRKRLPLACIACRRKKIKCSGEKPTCQHCMKSRIPCVYKITQRRATPRTDYMAMLDKRLKRMEDRVIKIIPKAEGEMISRAVLKPNFALASSGNTGKKRSGDQAFSNDLDAWASNQGAPSPYQFPHTTSATREDRGVAFEGSELLPPMKIQEHLAEVYFDFIYGQTYFLLHKGRYTVNLKAGTVPPYLVLAVCAIAARFSNHPEIHTEPAFLRGEEWARGAQEIALKYYDTPNVATLIVFLLLCLHGFGCCQGGRAWMMSGMAHRMAYALRLHKDPDHDGLSTERGSIVAFVEREVRRRAMWACFQVDRFTSSGTERPMFANERYMHLPLPVSEELFLKEIPAITETLDPTMSLSQGPSIENGQLTNARGNMGVAAYCIRAIALWGRLNEYMNLGGRTMDEKHSIWSSQSTWYALKIQVQDFKTNLPEDLRDTPENLQLHASSNTANSFLELHILSNYCILFLHRFAYPIIAVTKPCKGEPLNFLDNGKKAALDAANAISTIIEKALQYRVVFPFAGYAAYVSGAVHVHGTFSKDTALVTASRRYLTINTDYLTRMKMYWGMFHFLLRNLKELYRTHADAAQRGDVIPGENADRRGVYQYGDLNVKYTRGASATDYSEPLRETDVPISLTAGRQAELQSVEDFFESNAQGSAAPTGPFRPLPANDKRKKPRGKSQHMTVVDMRPPANPKQSTPKQQQQQQQQHAPNHYDTGLGSMDSVGPPFGAPESFDRFRPPPLSMQQPNHPHASPLSSASLQSPAHQMPPPSQIPAHPLTPQSHASSNMLAMPTVPPPPQSPAVGAPFIPNPEVIDPQAWDPSWTLPDEYFTDGAFDNHWNITYNIDMPGFPQQQQQQHPQQQQLPLGVPVGSANEVNSELQSTWWSANGYGAPGGNDMKPNG